jgi:translation initiation factor IF-3
VSKDVAQINDRIRAREVRLIGEDGTQFGIKPRDEALRTAEEQGLDLVLVAPNSEPPVCKIMDYGKFKYKQKKRQHEQHRHQPQLKELRLRPKTEEHDLMVRIKQARKFIERGDRVLVTVRFRGREMAHQELGRGVLDHFAELMDDVAKIETPARMAGRRMSMTLVKK